MRGTLWCLWVGIGCALVGCAPSSRSVIDDLPGPVFDTRPAPAKPAALPRLIPEPDKPPRPVLAEPGWRPPGGIRPCWEYIVIHHSGVEQGCARTFDRAHRDRGWDELGYHFVIGNGSESGDGQIEVGSRWIKQKHGAHCKTPDNRYNDHGIGICLVGDFTNHRPSPAQMASLERLIRFLSRECGIPANRITTHGAVTHRTACPGRQFPLAELKRDLQEVATVSSVR
jgi:hypothetical protein